MQRKRLAIIIDSLAGGGAEKVVLALASALQDLGHDAHIVVLENKVDYQLPSELCVHFLYPCGSVRIKGWFKRRVHGRKLIALLKGIEKRYGKFDGYISNLEESYRIAVSAGLSPCVHVIHNSLDETMRRTLKLGPIKYLYLKQTLKLLDGTDVITVSKGLQHEVERSRWFQPRSVHTIYNPYEIEKIRALANEPCPQLPKEPFIIFVGRTARQKRLDVLLEAFSQVRAPIKLVCLSMHKSKILRLARKYGVEERVITPGFQQNPYPWIKNAKILVLSSDYEGFGGVLVEAIACETIPVSTRCPHGPSEILSGNLQKYLVDTGSVKQLAQKLETVLNDAFEIQYSQILSLVESKASANNYLACLSEIDKEYPN